MEHALPMDVRVHAHRDARRRRRRRTFNVGRGLILDTPLMHTCGRGGGGGEGGGGGGGGGGEEQEQEEEDNQHRSGACSHPTPLPGSARR